MTAITHRQYSICFSLVANMLLFTFGITEINYYISLPIVLLVGKYGALFPDVDHAWNSVKDKTIVNWFINKFIHITGGKHRSWQTHSIDIVAIFTVFAVFIPRILFNLGKLSLVNKEVLSLVLIGFSAGWISHIFSDMLTSAGVKLICFLPVKLALVPKHIGKLRFNTGNEWEAFCYKFTRVINVIIGIIALIYPLVITGTIQNWLSSLTNIIH